MSCLGLDHWSAGGPGKVVGFATLSGANEVPPVVMSTGTGTAVFEVDFAAGTVMYNIVCSGLSGPITGAHIHTGSAGTNGGVQFSLTPGIGADGTTVNGMLTGVAGEQLASMPEIYVNVRYDLRACNASLFALVQIGSLSIPLLSPALSLSLFLSLFLSLSLSPSPSHSFSVTLIHWVSGFVNRVR